jgi:vitamin B12 transporter
MLFPRLLIIGVLAAPSCLFASGSDPRDVIVVTATRTETSLTDTIVPVTVIGRDRIEQSLATDLAELLRFEAGLDIGRNGGPGQATSIFMRGTESNHTLVLVDGVRINPGTIGGAALQHIDPEVVERIEIVRGSRSSLYGTDAIGGVINIITRRAAANYVEAGGGGGSYGTQTGFLSGGVKGTDSEFGLTVNWQATDGYEISPSSDIARGYDNLSANVYGRRSFGIGDLTLRHWRASGNVEYLDFFLSPLDQDYVNSSSAVELDTALGERARSKLIISYIVDEIEQNQGDDFVRSERTALDWQYSVDIPDERGRFYAFVRQRI